MENSARLLTVTEVADLFRVGPRTVIQWAVDGKLPSIRTPSRRRRFAESEIQKLLEHGMPDGRETAS